MSDIPKDTLAIAMRLAEDVDDFSTHTGRARHIARALMAERKKALDEAAKVAEEFNGMKHAAHDMATGAFPKQSYMGEAIAAAIRKLAEEPSHYPVMKPYVQPDSFTEEQLKAAIQKVARKD